MSLLYFDEKGELFENVAARAVNAGKAQKMQTDLNDSFSFRPIRWEAILDDEDSYYEQKCLMHDWVAELHPSQ